MHVVIKYLVLNSICKVTILLAAGTKMATFFKSMCTGKSYNCYHVYRKASNHSPRQPSFKILWINRFESNTDLPGLFL